MKKLLSVWLAVLCMVCAAVACGETSGDFEYQVLPDGTVEITGYTGDDEILTIPAQLDGRAVTSIGEDAFYDCYRLTSITIPDSVTSIGASAFYYCGSLTDITIPNSVTSIGDQSFYGCSSLTNITVPDSVTSIGDQAFFDCSSLTSITIPDGVTSIGRQAFAHCCSLTSLAIPDSVTCIGSGAFYSCSSLTEINIPIPCKVYNSGLYYNDIDVTEAIDAGAYYESDDIWEIILDIFDECESLPYADYSLYWLEDSVVIKEYHGDETELVIPAEIYGRPVTSIGDEAFRGCESLTSVTIPDSVTSIGDYAFSCCENLISLAIPDSVTSIGAGAFIYCSNLTNIKIPIPCKVINYGLNEDDNGTWDCEQDIFEGCYSLPYVDYSLYWLEDSVAINGYYGDETELVIPAEIYGRPVTSIGDYAFDGNTELTSITIPAGVMSIGEGSFEDCDSLTAVIVTPGSYAEQYCKDNGLPYTCAD